MIKRSAFTLQLTERCNLACEYCYVRKRASLDLNDCSLKLCESFIDFALREAGNYVKIAFFGGEPLLRPDLIRHTVNYAKKSAHRIGKVIAFHIVTNGTLLKDAIGDFIAKEDIRLEVSIDGPQKIHDHYRPYLNGSGSFHTVHDNLLRFRKRHPNHEIQIFSVITGTKSLPWLQSFLKQLKTSAFTFNPVHLPPEEEKNCWKKQLNIAQHALKKRVVKHRKQFLLGDACFDAGINCQMSFFLNEKTVRSCEVGIDTTITTQSGKIYPCPLFIGHEDQVIGDIFHGFCPEKVKPYIERTVDALHPCSQCAVKYFCGGGCAFGAYQQNGSINSTSMDSCFIAKQYARELESSIISLASRKPEALLKSTGMSTENLVFQPAPQPQAITPNSFVIRLTGKCNLSCSYCFDKKPSSVSDRLDVKTAGSIVDYILSSSSKKPVICLFGGEPLLNWKVGHFLIQSLATEAKKNQKTPFFHITTNGTLITEKIAETLARYDVTVQISIDGSKVDHDRHRKYASGLGSYEAILRGIEILRKVDRSVKTDAQVVLTPGNTDMVHIVKELKAKGFRRINFLKSTWEDRSSVKWSLTDIKRLVRAREEFFPFFIESAIQGNADIDMGFASLVASEPKGPEGLCECGTAEVYIDTKGDIYPCPQIYSRGTYVLGNCVSSRLQKGINFNALHKTIEADCSRCWAYSRCRGGCAVHCQRCPFFPSQLQPEDKNLWCDLMRAEFARAIVAHKILQRYHPESLKTLQSIFTA